MTYSHETLANVHSTRCSGVGRVKAALVVRPVATARAMTIVLHAASVRHTRSTPSHSLHPMPPKPFGGNG